MNLETPLLEYFLKRLNVNLALTNDEIPYQEVINTFKQKTDPTKRRINADNPTSVHPRRRSSFSIFVSRRHVEETRQAALERQIDCVVAMNYERVDDFLNRTDGLQSGLVTVNVVRLLIEDLIEYTLKPDEYHQILKKMPLDEYGRVKYREYLKQVLERAAHFQEIKLPKSK